MNRHQFDTSGPDAGFTLVELAVVVMIIGVLLGIAMVSYRGASANAEEAACMCNQRVLSCAMVTYRSVEGTGCTDFADLAPYARDVSKCSLCPSDGTPLILDPETDQVSCPNHPR